MMEKYSYDVIIPVASKDVAFVPRVIKYIRKNLKESDPDQAVRHDEQKQRF